MLFILFCFTLRKMLFRKCLFSLPCLSLIKLKKYNFGKWSQLLNKAFDFVFYEKSSGWLHKSSTDQHCPVDIFACKKTLPATIMSIL